MPRYGKDNSPEHKREPASKKAETRKKGSAYPTGRQMKKGSKLECLACKGKIANCKGCGGKGYIIV
jgi:hypothetical protein